MLKFFNKYKKIRQDQKIDLSDIGNRTNINIKYLKALESGEFHLIQEPYTRLFLRAYISEIGADPDIAVDELTEYLLKNDDNKTAVLKEKEPETVITDKKQTTIKPQVKQDDKFKDISSNIASDKARTKPNFSPQIIKGILLIIVWIAIIIVIRNVTLNNNNPETDTQNSQAVDSIVNYISLEQLQSDYIELSSQQSAIEQSLPLIIRIVTNKSLGIVAMQDSTETAKIPLASGDQEIFSFDTKLNILLSHSEGVVVFINGDRIQAIKSQQDPVQIMFLVEPKSVTIKHFGKTL